MPKGLVFVWMEIPKEHEEEFKDWYETEHIPQRLAVPGFLDVCRYAAAGEGPQYLTTYLLEDPAVLESPGYLAISWNSVSPWSRRINRKAAYLHRNVYVEISPPREGTAQRASPGDRSSTGALLLECAEVPPGAEAEFNAWYDSEHVPALLAIPGFRAARRFGYQQGQARFQPEGEAPRLDRHGFAEGQPRYVALYELDELAALSQETYRELAGAAGSATGAATRRWLEYVRPMEYREIYHAAGSSSSSD